MGGASVSLEGRVRQLEDEARALRREIDRLNEEIAKRAFAAPICLGLQHVWRADGRGCLCGAFGSTGPGQMTYRGQVGL